jgi:CubicO group peptidase (beta-lactamase class C family)
MSSTYTRLIRALVVLVIMGTTIAATPAAGYARVIPQTSATSVTMARTEGSARPDFADIDAYVQRELDKMHIPGAAVGIVEGDQALHLQSFGEADNDGRLVTTSTPFKIGSTSKSFTALAVMQLVDQGRIKLDDPVQVYLPWFRAAGEASSKRITVRELLNQTSGFSTAAGMTWTFTKDTSDDALENVVRDAKSVKISSAPGEKYQYSNLNYTTLGLIVQAVSGQSYEGYVEDHIFEPLKMTHSHAFLSDAEADGLATGHQFWFGRPQTGGGLVNNRATTPAGLLTSSAEDLTHYLIAHLNAGHYEGAQVLSPASMSVLHDGAAKMSEHASYAMGWIAGELHDIPVLGHNGDTGDFHTTMVLQAERRLGVVVLMNGANDLDAGMDRIADGIMAKLLGVAPPKPIGAASNLPLLLVEGLVILILLQVLAALRSIMLLRRWGRPASSQRHGSRWIAGRVVVAGAVSLVWALFALLVLPPALGMPWPVLTHVDMGWPVIITGVIALLWGAIAKPGIAIRALVRARSRARAAAPPDPALKIGAP